MKFYRCQLYYYEDIPDFNILENEGFLIEESSVEFFCSLTKDSTCRAFKIMKNNVGVDNILVKKHERDKEFWVSIHGSIAFDENDQRAELIKEELKCKVLEVFKKQSKNKMIEIINFVNKYESLFEKGVNYEQ
jgi:hypothetical protein